MNMNSGRDIVGQMVDEMNLTPARADFLNQQQPSPMMGQMPQMPMQQSPFGGMPMQQQAPQMMGGMAPMPDMSAEQQLQMMQSMGANGGDDETTTNISQYQQSESEQRAPETTLEMICRIGKGPLIVGVLFVIFSLKYIDDIIRQILPSFLSGKELYYLIAKAVFVGSAYMLSRLFVEDDTC